MVALVLAIFLAAFAVMFYVTRMTKRILRAIDLAAWREVEQEGGQPVG